MTDWRDYADQVEVAVSLVEDQESEPSEVWAIRLYGPPAKVDEFENEMQHLAFSEEQQADRPHILTSRRTYYSWGADAVGWQQILEIAAHYGDVALTAAVTYQFAEWWRKHRGRDELPPPLERETAEDVAFWAIVLSYKSMQRGALQIVSEERDDRSAWTFKVTAPGHVFTVRVGYIDGVPTAVNIRCEFVAE
jgi:hypothetical protein